MSHVLYIQIRSNTLFIRNPFLKSIRRKVRNSTNVYLGISHSSKMKADIVLEYNNRIILQSGFTIQNLQSDDIGYHPKH